VLGWHTATRIPRLFHYSLFLSSHRSPFFHSHITYILLSQPPKISRYHNNLKLMAQPIFDEHPLQDYLTRSLPSLSTNPAFSSHRNHPLSFTESGDILEPIPGAISGLVCPFSDACGDEESDHDLKLCSWLTPPSLRLAEVSLAPYHLSRGARSVGRSDCCNHLLVDPMCHHIHHKRSPDLHYAYLQNARTRPPSRVIRHVSSLSFHFFMTAMTASTSLMLNVFIFQFFNIVVTSVHNHHSTLQEFSERFKYDVISSSLLASSITAPSSTRRRSSSLDDSLSDDLDPNPTTQLPPPPPSQPAVHRGPAQSLSLFGLFLISIFFDSFLLYVFIVTVLYYLESYALVSGHVPAFIPPVRALPPVCSILRQR
jgi:hypothetical protein